MTDTITFTGADMVHLDPGDFSWVNLKTFKIDPDVDDHGLLTALLDHPQYHDHYAGQPVEQQTHHSLHGPYQLSAISTDAFAKTDPLKAEQLLRAWADEPEPSLDTTHERLRRRVYPALQVSELYQLPALGESAQHEWGWVVGAGGFHEFIAIDRTNATLTLVVASDD